MNNAQHTAITFSRDAQIDGYVASNGYSIVRTYAGKPGKINGEYSNGTYYRGDRRAGSTVYGYEVRDPQGQVVASITKAASAKDQARRDAERVAEIVTDPQSETIAKIDAAYGDATVAITNRNRFHFPMTPVDMTVTAKGSDGIVAQWVVAADGTPTRTA